MNNATIRSASATACTFFSRKLRQRSLLAVAMLLATSICTALAFAAPTSQPADSADGEIAKYYTIETIPTPAGVVPEVGGMAFTPDGRLVVCFHDGDVWTYTPENRKWDRFAESLHEPLGIVASNDDEVVVMQRPELTRITDSDADGVADQYKTVTDQFGMSGNYHEFAFGPAMDSKGNFFIALNCASNGAGIRQELRGEYRENGRTGRMYSCIPYRGWILEVSPDGKVSPFALGFRSPNGLGFDLKGNLWATDNQGDWVGTSPLYHVRKDKFYGHAASLIWKPGFTGEPLDVPVKELNAMRTRPAVQFPHGLMANSPTQPMVDSSKGKFGPYAGQLLVGEMNQPRIMRILLDEVRGEYQGAAIPFYDKAGLKAGVNRMAFAPDGSLYVGHDMRDRAWIGAKGIQRLTWNKKLPMDVLAMKLTPTGFDLTFTRPVEQASAENIANYTIRRYHYEYHQAYGSDQFDIGPAPVESAKLSADKKTVSLTLEHLREGYVFEFRLGEIVSADDRSALANRLICYTLNQTAEGTAPAMLTKGPPPQTRPATKPAKKPAAKKPAK